MSTYIFLGPTIPVSEAQQWLQATYLSPVAQGDLAGLLKRRPKIIGIIDGYFEGLPSVWHKEILLALSQGIHVIGASSMGALRAAELYSFGMVGIGEIFRWYKDGEIEADDEVAVRHASQEYGFRSQSEALVNIRQTLRSACDRAIIQTSTYETLLNIAKGMHYSERIFSSLLECGLEARLPNAEIARLREFLRKGKVDQKKLDAISMLNHISSIQKSEKRHMPNFQLEYTARLDDLIDKDTILVSRDSPRLTPEMFVEQISSTWEDYSAITDRALSNQLTLELARSLDIRISEEEFTKGIAAFQKSVVDTMCDDLSEWTRRNHLADEDFEQLVKDWLLIQKMRDLYRLKNREIIRQLRLEGKFIIALQATIDDYCNKVLK